MTNSIRPYKAAPADCIGGCCFVWSERSFFHFYSQDILHDRFHHGLLPSDGVLYLHFVRGEKAMSFLSAFQFAKLILPDQAADQSWKNWIGIL